MKFQRRPNPRRAAFTLVEMLIVLGILVAMFALVLPRFLGSQKKAKVDLAKTQIGMFRGALERYYVDCDQFPTTEQGLRALAAKPADLPDKVTWRGPYVSGDIADDPWGNPYQYENPPTHGDGDTPDIWSYGPNGEEGGDDDICSWSGSSASGEGDSPPGDLKEPKSRAPVRSAKEGSTASTKTTSRPSPKASTPKPPSRPAAPRPPSDNP